MAYGNLYKFSGKIGAVVGYQLNGKQVMRALPKEYTQTRATKRSASLFGKASTLGASIRNPLLDLIPFPSDNKMQTRLSTSILRWLRENEKTPPESGSHISFIENFQFNEAGPGLSDRWKVIPEVDVSVKGKLEIKIPSFVPVFSTAAPQGTSSLILDFAAVSCSLKTGMALGSEIQRMQLDYNNKETVPSTVTLTIPSPKGIILVAALSLKFMVTRKLGLLETEDPKYKPSAILTAMYF